MKLTLSNMQDVYKSKQVSIETMQYKGYELIENLFVDSSGFGAENELALTPSQFEKELTRIINENGGMVYATITDVGQFQIYVGMFKKSGVKRSSRIANNTLEILDSEGNRKAIRLHDTNILIYENDYIILDNGGWQSKTTKERMNEYLPQSVYISQNNFTWYVNDSRDNTKKEYINGMRIAN